MLPPPPVRLRAGGVAFRVSIASTAARHVLAAPSRTIMGPAPRQPRLTCLSPSGGTMADMARRTATPPPPEDFEENIVDIDVAEEMRGSFLEYAYSVIYQR